MVCAGPTAVRSDLLDWRADRIAYAKNSWVCSEFDGAIFAYLALSESSAADFPLPSRQMITQMIE